MQNNFNPYGNYGYNYGYNPNQYQNNNNYQQPKTNQYYWVNGIASAKSYQLQPNQNVMLMDNDEPLVYMKTTDGLGKANLRIFKLVEVSEEELKQNESSKNNEYVLKSDFEALMTRVDNLSAKLEKPYKNERNVEKGGN